MKKKLGQMLAVLVSLVLLCITISGCSSGIAGGKQDYKILAGSSFSEGLAWIAGEKENGEQFVGAINPKGQVVFTVDNGKIPKDSDSLHFITFGSESGVIEMNDDTKSIVSKKGEVLYNTYGDMQKNDDYYYIYDANSKQIGIMDGKGSWKTPLHTPDDNENDFWRIQALEMQLSGKSTYGEIIEKSNSNRYGIHTIDSIGDGYFYANSSSIDSNHTIYNSKNNQFVSFQLPGEKIYGIHALEDQFFIISQTQNRPYAVKGYLFDNTGKCVKDYGTLNEMSIFGTITSKIVFDKTEGIYYILGGSGEKRKFFAVNKDGKILFDDGILTNGMEIEEVRLADDGYVGLTTERSNKYYYTVAKSDGTLCFNPVDTGFTTSTSLDQMENIFASEDFGNGTFVIRTDYGQFNIVDLEGNVKNRLTFSEDEDFRKGFSDGLSYLSEEKCYINNLGEIAIKANPFAENNN